MKLKISLMTGEDLLEVVEIERKIFPSPWSMRTFKRDLHSPQAIMLTAKWEEKVVGYAALFYIYGEGHITNLAVAPSFRGKMIGSRLVLELIKRGFKRGVKKLTLEVRESNLAAQALYGKFGFFLVNTRRNYYAETQEDALILNLENIDSEEYQKKLQQIEELLETNSKGKSQKSKPQLKTQN